MDWFIYDNGPRHERVKQVYYRRILKDCKQQGTKRWDSNKMGCTQLFNWFFKDLFVGEMSFSLSQERVSPAGIYLFKVNNGKVRTMCEISSKLTLKTGANDVALALLTLFWFFHCWLWASKCRLGRDCAPSSHFFVKSQQ